ncbi:MAG: HlyD family efflux transporter periplasmic adaptor subunit [candidate division Zixibacteria bacterium]
MRKIIVPFIVIAAISVSVIVYISNDKSADDSVLVLSGAIETVEIDLAFTIPGRLDNIFSEESEAVSSGDTVAELSHKESLARLRQIEAQIAAAVANKDKLGIEKEALERNLSKVARLVISGGATSGEKEDLEDKIRVVEATIISASSSIDALNSQKDYLEITVDEEYLTSPVDGMVILRSAEPGEVVNPGKTILTVADLSKLEIKVYLPESKLGLIEIGQLVEIKIDSFPDTSYEGMVRRISDKAEFTPKNVQTREERVKTVFAVIVSADDQGGILKPGMPCDVIIDLTR